MSQLGPQQTVPQVPAQDKLWVICLCAQWCDICRRMRASLQQDHWLPPLVNGLWVDIEDHADLLGDLEVETFPTYLIGRHGEVLLYAPGPTLPDAIASYVMPYVSGRVAAAAAPEPVRQAFAAISLRFKMQ